MSHKGRKHTGTKKLPKSAFRIAPPVGGAGCEHVLDLLRIAHFLALIVLKVR
jgi:hypothetical protein